MSTEWIFTFLRKRENKMCDTELINPALFGMQTGAVISNYLTQKEQDRYYKNYQALQTASIINNYNNQVSALQDRFSEEAFQTGWQKQQTMIANMKARATAQASAASSGVEGQSINKLFDGYDRATAINDYISDRNLQMKGRQYNRELEGARAKALSALNGESKYASTAAAELIGGIGGLLSNYASNDYKITYYNKKGR